MTETGKWIIPAKYQGVLFLGSGIYLVTDFEVGSTYFPSGKLFLLDDDGKPFNVPLPEGCKIAGVLSSLPAKNQSELLFSIMKDHHYGVCDIKGKIILAPTYDSIKSYSEGYFVVLADGSKSTEFLDSQGSVIGKVPTAQFDFKSNGFHQGGIIGASTKQSKVVGAIEPYCFLESYSFFGPDGKALTLPFELGYADEFSEGYAGVVVKDENGRGLFAAMIDKHGKVLNDKKFKWIFSFKSGQAIASTAADLWGVIDHSGEFVIPPIYQELRVNNERSYIATTPEGDVLIDRQGRLICKYNEKLELLPSETKLHECVLLSRKPPRGCFGVKSIADENGHIYDERSHLPKDVVMPIWRADEDNLAGLRRNDKWITPVAFQDFSRLSNGNWWAIQETVRFDKEDWKMKLDRPDLFHHLLRERNLIGMDKSELISLLGVEQGADSNLLSYDFTAPNVRCGNATRSLSIQFENNKLKRWSLNGMDWITQNVVYKQERRGSEKYEPKSPTAAATK